MGPCWLLQWLLAFPLTLALLCFELFPYLLSNFQSPLYSLEAVLFILLSLNLTNMGAILFNCWHGATYLALYAVKAFAFFSSGWFFFFFSTSVTCCLTCCNCLWWKQRSVIMLTRIRPVLIHLFLCHQPAVARPLEDRAHTHRHTHAEAKHWTWQTKTVHFEHVLFFISWGISPPFYPFDVTGFFNMEGVSYRGRADNTDGQCPSRGSHSCMRLNSLSKGNSTIQQGGKRNKASVLILRYWQTVKCFSK